MHEALSKILAKHGVQSFEFIASPTKDFAWTLKTLPPATPELEADFRAAIASLEQIEFVPLTMPEAPYSYLGVAIEDIHAGQRVEYCANKGLCRKER
jgi:hypothetical protein